MSALLQERGPAVLRALCLFGCVLATSGCLLDFDGYHFAEREQADGGHPPSDGATSTATMDSGKPGSDPDPDPGDGGARDASEPDASVDCAAVAGAVEPVYSSPYLNHYVSRNGADAFTASGRSCASELATSPDDCIHAGLLRQFRVQTHVGCQGVSIRDDLDALQWSCHQDGAGLLIRSSGLQPDAPLSRLVDFRAAALRPISVRVSSAACPALVSTAPALLWSDIVETVDLAAVSPLILGESNRIYLITYGEVLPVDGLLTIPDLQLNASSASLVVDPAVRAAPRQAGDSLLRTGGHSYEHIWIEGRFDCAARLYWGLILDADMSLFRNIDTTHGTPTPESGATLLIGGTANRVERISASGVSSAGLEIAGRGHRVRDVTVDTQGEFALSCRGTDSDLRQLRLSGGKLSLEGSNHRVSDVQIDGAPFDSLYVGGEGGHRLDHVSIANALYGVWLRSDNNTLSSLQVSNIIDSALIVGAAGEPCSDNRVVNAQLSSSDTAAAVELLAAHRSVLLQVSVLLSEGGIQVGSDPSTGNLLAQVLAYNNRWGLRLTNSSSGTTVRDSMFAGSVVPEDDLAIEAENSRFDGRLLLSHPGACTVAAGLAVPGLAVGPGDVCEGRGASKVTVSGGHGSPVVGVLVGGDAVNGSPGASSAPPFPSSGIRDWFGFEHPRRVFGRWGGGAALPAASAVGTCPGGDCAVYDWSVRKGMAADLAADVADAAWVVSHTWNAASAGECAAIEGAVWGAACVTEFLASAYERFGDGIGNDNGLCESNEACIEHPGLGAELRAPESVLEVVGQVVGQVGAGTLSNITLYRVP